MLYAYDCKTIKCVTAIEHLIEEICEYRTLPMYNTCKEAAPPKEVKLKVHIYHNMDCQRKFLAEMHACREGHKQKVQTS